MPPCGSATSMENGQCNLSAPPLPEPTCNKPLMTKPLKLSASPQAIRTQVPLTSANRRISWTGRERKFRQIAAEVIFQPLTVSSFGKNCASGRNFDEVREEKLT